MLERDVANINASLGRFAPDLLETDHAREMWALFEAGTLRPDSVLTGVVARDERPADVDAVMEAIDEARDEAMRRQRGRDEANALEAA
jgi:RIO kinase 1